MNKIYLAICITTFVLSPLSASSHESSYEAKLNTANTIRAAFELRRLSESLAPGVDTRCYIAKLAAFHANSLPQSANIIARYPSGNEQSDAFAIQSTNETMEIFNNNQVNKIVSECKVGS